jgi:taurine dioxygenase
MSGQIACEALDPVGARLDIDLSVPLDADQQDELRGLLAEHHLFVLEGQSLTLDDQVRVMSIFGPVSRNEGPAGVGDFVSRDTKEGGLASGALAFHSDLAHSPIPMIAISLHALDVTPGATSTMFVDGARTLARLPQDLQDRIDGLEVWHCFPTNTPEQFRTFGAPPSEINEALPLEQRPIVMEHPRTGEPVLYVFPMMTDHVVGMPLAESDELLAELFSYLYEPGNIYEHPWKNGDVVIWDNIAVQHGRRDQHDVATRLLQRVVSAEKGFYEQHPNMVQRGGHAVLADY